MAKIDKRQYTKDQWRRIKAERKAQKQLRKQEKEFSKVVNAPVPEGTDKFIVCLKHGQKYNADYVNKLYSMVTRNCTVPHQFVCFTEDPKGIHPKVRIEPLPQQMSQVQGWWYKPMFFDPGLALQGTILYIDLDVIIFNNIDYLFSFEPDKFCIIRDFNRVSRHDWRRMNSSVFRLETGKQSHVYTKFMEDPIQNMRRMHGDQDWIYQQVKEDWAFWPNDWIMSYKWEMRNRPTVIRDSQGRRNFDRAGDPVIRKDTSIAVFHGEPLPDYCVDPWCQKNWV